MLNPAMPTQITVMFRPTVAASQNALLFLIDQDDKSLVYAHYLSLEAARPVVSKSFELKIPCGSIANKKVAYKNPYTIQKAFLLFTDRPEVVRLKRPKLEIRPSERDFIQMAVSAPANPTAEDVLIFINDLEDKNEECILLRLLFE